MNLELKLAILKRFPSQADFAFAVGEHESKVSNIVRGRRKLQRVQAQNWKQVLNCDHKILESVIED